MSDGRKNNGNKGHSTKAKGADKRKNDYRVAIQNAASVDDVTKVLKKCLEIAASDDKDRLQAIKILLEYTLGKPMQQVDVTTDGNEINIVPLEWIKSDD